MLKYGTRIYGGHEVYDSPMNFYRQMKMWGAKHPVMILCVLTLMMVMQGRGNAQVRSAPLDADALVRQMVARYKSLQTLQETSESKFIDSQGREFIQTTLLKYKLPNFIYLETHDPKQGTLLLYCNGRLATFYTGKQNIYTRRRAAPTCVRTLEEMSKASIAMIGLPQNQVLSPLSFLAANRMPSESSNFRYVKMETIEGKRVALLTGAADLTWSKTLFPVATQLIFQKRDVSLWIDLNTKLLVRASFDLIWQLVTDRGNIPGRMRFVETHRNVMPNAPLRDEDFNVAPPKGAEEKFLEVR